MKDNQKKFEDKMGAKEQPPKDEKALFLSEGGLALVKDKLDGANQIVVVCFGTMAISGDSLGPMVGTLLKDEFSLPAFIYGTQQKSVNGKNMSEWLDFVKSVHKGATFIAVDASLGQKDRVGQIQIRQDGVCPAAVQGKRMRFGDIGVLGVVSKNDGDALMQLMAVSQLYVQELAHKVALCVKNIVLQR